MTEANAASGPPGEIPGEAFTYLVDRGRAKGSLTLDEVISVLRHVELTPELIDGVRRQLRVERVELDEAIELADDPLTPPAGVLLAPVADPPPASTPTPATPHKGSAAGGRLAGRDTGDRAGSSDPVRTYLKEIGKIRLLSGPDEVMLARRIEAGLEAAARIAALEDSAADRGAGDAEAAVAGDDVRPEAVDDGPVPVGPDRHHLPGQSIGVDHHRSPLGQHRRHGGLPGPDPTRQAHNYHGRKGPYQNASTPD